MGNVSNEVRTPLQEWEEFYEKAVVLKQLTPTEIYTLKLVFFGALLTTTSFFDDLMGGGEYSHDERIRRYALWKDGLQVELDKLEVMVMGLAEVENGRTN
jgi:hypothetical protein